MKRLRKLALNLDRGIVSNEYGYRFYLRSRSLCNYIERILKSRSIAVVDSTKLVICGELSDTTSYSVNSSEIACLTVPFDPRLYDGCQTNHDINAYMVRFLSDNLRRLPTYPCESIDDLTGLAHQFEQEGYQNRWLHKQKKVPDLSAVAELICNLTPDEFTLRLSITAAGEVVFEKVILQTDPDELAFHYRFRDLVLDGDYLLVTSKVEGEPLFRLSVRDLVNAFTANKR